MRVALYARVSTSDQKCEMQLRELRQYVLARGWEVFKEYIDEGFSGRDTKKRIGLRNCLADAKARKFDTIIVWKFDRWGRTVAQLVGDVLELDSAGIRFISLMDGIDTDKTNATSRLLMHIMAAFAEFERAVIQERVATGFNQYKSDFEEGKNPVSKSGLNLPIGRPKVIFNRDLAKKLRTEGKSWGEISKVTGATVATVRRVCAG